MARYWHRVVPLICAAGHEAVAVDLPGDDQLASLTEYTNIVIRAITLRSDVILVAKSLAGFTAPLVCARVPIKMFVLVNAMIPKPGETAGAWWEATGAIQARELAAKRGGYPVGFDIRTHFLHDLPAAVLCDGPRRPREEAKLSLASPVNLSAGLRFLFRSLRVATIASSLSNFNGASLEKGSKMKLT